MACTIHMLCYTTLCYVMLCYIMLPPFVQNYPSHLHALCLAAFSLRKIMKLGYMQTIVIIVQWLWTPLDFTVHDVFVNLFE